MSTAVVGLGVGLVLGFAGYFGGFAAFLLVAALGALGWIVGRLAEGDERLREFLGSRGGRNR